MILRYTQLLSQIAKAGIKPASFLVAGVAPMAIGGTYDLFRIYIFLKVSSKYQGISSSLEGIYCFSCVLYGFQSSAPAPLTHS